MHRPGALIWLAAVFSVVDCYVPFSYPTESTFEIFVIAMVFASMRPAKMLLLAFKRGFLAHDMSLQQHIVFSLLPVASYKALPESSQKRLPVFDPSPATLLEFGCWVGAAVLASADSCSIDPVNGGFQVRALLHVLLIFSVMQVVMFAAAFLAAVLGSEQVVRPFNSFWRAQSMAVEIQVECRY